MIGLCLLAKTQLFSPLASTSSAYGKRPFLRKDTHQNSYLSRLESIRLPQNLELLPILLSILSKFLQFFLCETPPSGCKPPFCAPPKPSPRSRATGSLRTCARLLISVAGARQVQMDVELLDALAAPLEATPCSRHRHGRGEKTTGGRLLMIHELYSSFPPPIWIKQPLHVIKRV